LNAETKPSHFWDHSGRDRSFSDRVAQLLSRVDCRRGENGEHREAILRLRYQAYAREGAISSNSLRAFSDRFDDADNACLFALYVEGELASSLRLHIGSKEYPDFPSLEVFRDHLQPKLDAGKVLIDTTGFVADEKLCRQHRDLPYVTLRLLVLAAEYFAADECLAAVRIEHQAFFRRAFNYRVICESGPHPQLAKPISLTMLHFPSAANELYRKYPFFRSSFFERHRLFERRQQLASSRQRSADS
jgi:hypothetical protein